MTKQTIDEITKIKTIGDVINAAIMRIGFFIIFYYSPELAKVLITLME